MFDVAFFRQHRAMTGYYVGLAIGIAILALVLLDREPADDEDEDEASDKPAES